MPDARCPLSLTPTTTTTTPTTTSDDPAQPGHDRPRHTLRAMERTSYFLNPQPKCPPASPSRAFPCRCARIGPSTCRPRRGRMSAADGQLAKELPPTSDVDTGGVARSEALRGAWRTRHGCQLVFGVHEVARINLSKLVAV